MNVKFSLLAPAVLALVACSDTNSITDATPDFRRGGKGHEKANASAAHTYRVTIENLTSGQPLSPGVVAVHTKSTHVFEEGEPASEGIRLIAEDGAPGTAFGELDGAPGVHDVVTTPLPVGCIDCPGPFPSTLVIDIEAKANAKYLSMALMLICTNDGFAGIDGVKLPGGFKPATFFAVGYDAGTEANDELFASIVDPCGGIGPVAAGPDGEARPATAGVVTAHPGITGVGDLTMPHEWTEPVARVTVERMK